MNSEKRWTQNDIEHIKAKRKRVLSVIRNILEEIDSLHLYYADRENVKRVIYSHMDEILNASSHLGETGNNKEQ